jgi:NRE family putative nickel resistance protein-like MFS transporter
VYGAHFAWSHLWWAFAYPLTGLLSTWFPERTFLFGGLISLAVLLAVWAISRRPAST